ncbi:MAG: choline-sulfatase [Planctomycetota bacterium]|jgi:choline-sulfatase
MRTLLQLRPASLSSRPTDASIGLWLPSLALVLAPFVSLACGGDEPAVDRRPDIVLVTIDTVRADHLDLYGYGRETAPRIAELGRAGLVFEQAIAQAPWTLPSMASIHTGLYPSEHGAIGNTTPLAANHPVIAEMLKARGYETQAVTSHVFVSSTYGFARGFDNMDESHIPGRTGSSSQIHTELALAAHRAAGDAPLFLWVHYFDPHYSYLRHREYGFAADAAGRFDGDIHFVSSVGEELHDASPEELEYIRSVYDEEIASTDHWVGELIAGVRGSERTRPTVFVVTADHGEAFLDHGRMAHGKDVYDEMVRVPLVIGGDIDASLRGRRVKQPVETASIAATVLELAGIERHMIPGVSLISGTLSDSLPRDVYTEGSYAAAPDQRKRSIIHGTWKLILHLDDDHVELYNRATDPAEREDLAEDPESQVMRNTLLAALARQRSSATANAPQADLSEEERSKLDALGYFGD